MKRHNNEQIARLLSRATELQSRGMVQSTIAKDLGISVMTLHRWRAGRAAAPVRQAPQRQTTMSVGLRLASENAALRRIITDLLIAREEARESTRSATFSSSLASRSLSVERRQTAPAGLGPAAFR
jgi:putative transposase